MNFAPTRRALLRSSLGACVFAATLLLAGCGTATAANPAVATQETHSADIAFAGTKVRLANAQEGARELASRDEWVRLSSQWNRAAIVGTPEPVGDEALLAHLASAAREWTPAEQARLAASLKRLSPRFEALHVPLPPLVVLVKTDGRESAGAPHTRGRAVFLPLTDFPADDAKLDGLMSHELFHVVSRHAPELARRLYAVIGFEPVPELVWPASLQAVRIVNPDAPYHRDAMRLARPEGGEALVMPILVAGRPIDRTKNETFFNVLRVRFIEVSVDGAQTLPRLDAKGDAVDASPELVKLYMDKLGGNTGYVIHPEETMADNFMLLVTGAKARNPALIERVREVLLAQ